MSRILAFNTSWSTHVGKLAGVRLSNKDRLVGVVVVVVGVSELFLFFPDPEIAVAVAVAVAVAAIGRQQLSMNFGGGCSW